MNDEHVRELAVLVQMIAANCWSDLGTDLTGEIITRTGAIIESIDSGASS